MLTIVTGAQFGDEGKGRIVHNLCLQEGVVGGARAQGANNAGHTVVHEGVTYKLHLIPSSVVAGKVGYIGRGVAVDLDVLVDGIEQLQSQGIVAQLVLDPCAHVILPWHLTLDQMDDAAQGKFSAGSTKRGVAPVYAAKHARWGVRVIDFLEHPERVDQVMEHYLHRIANGQSASLRVAYQQILSKTRQRFLPHKAMVRSVAQDVEQVLQSGAELVGECAQGEMLDVNNPYYPFGTSSVTNAAGMWTGLGVGAKPQYMGQVIGVAKAYVSRVGQGPFPTEIHGDEAVALREKGKEYGTTTGRPRRVGWFDVPMVQVAKRASGLTGLALTKIDVLGGMEVVKVASAYTFQGELCHDVPAKGYDACVPSYLTLQGWPAFSVDEYREQLGGGVSAVPDPALRHFLQAIEKETGLPIVMVAYGAESDAFVQY
jgi:adenylosuccinate synthase